MNFKLQLGLNNCTNAEYHGDKSYISSSGLKTLLESPEKFYKENILGEREPQEENPNFIEGSLTHSLILEPEKVDQEYAFFPGMRKQGKEFEDFKVANEGKVIISAAQSGRCKAYLRAYQNLPTAVNLIKGGFPEYSICQEIKSVPLKMRADYINLDAGYIIDVKTTSHPAEVESFKLTIEQYKYELSAALYALIAETYYGRPFEFYWLVIGKKDFDCQVYRMSPNTRRQGLLLVNKALDVYTKCKATGIWTASTTEKLEKGNYEIIDI